MAVISKEHHVDGSCIRQDGQAHKEGCMMDQKDSQRKSRWGELPSHIWDTLLR